MYKYLRKILFLSFLLLTISFVYSDTEDCYEGGLINIRENFFSEDIIGYYLSAIDIESGESNVLLFDYSIDLSAAKDDSSCEDSGFLPDPDGDDPLEIFFDFDIQLYVPEYDQFASGSTPLVNGSVKLYNIPSYINEISFRNTDLNFDTRELQGGTKFELLNYDTDLTGDDIEQLQEDFLALSRLPNGSYYFNFYLKKEDGTIYDSLTKEISIFVPTYLELIAPGSASIADTVSNTIMMNNPTFQWNADFCSNCNLAIRVCEYRSDDHSSLSEAMEDYSVLPVEEGYYELDNSNINSFQYPLYDAGSLLNGSTYVWQLMRSYNTTNGINEEFSNIFVFKIQSLDEGTDLSSFSEEDLENLRLLIGDEQYNNLFGPDGELENYKSLDQTVMINGESISVNFLIELINKLNEGQINIIEVNVE